MVSIIIAVKGFNDFLKESLQKCLKLAYQDYEIIVLPDEEFTYPEGRVRVIPTGPCLPAKKRNIGSAQAKGEILAFLDDDAYPSESWLTCALKNFEDADVAAVGGPAVTPPTEDFLRRSSGRIYESFLASGTFRYRYIKAKKRLVDDYPSCNLIVRKDIFERLGGFKTNFWPGEDTHLCLEITKRLNKKIVYDPEALVFHHRRPLFLPHLKQICSYALHRGYFVKRFPETSLRWQYFIPTVFLVWLVLGLYFAFFDNSFAYVYAGSILAYGLFVLANVFNKRDIKMAALVTLGVFLTHICYGLYFIFGLIAPSLKEEAGT
ncbi:MAG: glycosyltransferase [Candidatus Omnitrophota bacterium]|mgnify:CR=1 FL=1